MRFEMIPGEPEAEVVEAILKPLQRYNREKAGPFFAARELPEHAAVPLHLVVYDDGGAVAGGAIGESQFSWMKVKYLAVREDHRGRGTGTKLMDLAEAEARRRGCKYVVLDTMSYQAPEFYSKLGYRVAGEIADWDSHGGTKFWFVKTL